MVAELEQSFEFEVLCCSLAKISMVAERAPATPSANARCSLAKISMVAEPRIKTHS